MKIPDDQGRTKDDQGRTKGQLMSLRARARRAQFGPLHAR
jgi:hypothetical protein